jgi:hypothetical protein
MGAGIARTNNSAALQLNSEASGEEQWRHSMGVRILDTSDGILTASVSGRMTPADLDQLQRAAATSIQEHGDGRFLVIADDTFLGWDRGNWEDTSFQAKFDPQIKKIAIVCDPKWTDQVLMFAGQGVRRVAIEHFPPSELAKAREWLRSAEQ